MNIPFKRKRNIWLGYFGGLGEVGQWDGLGKGLDQGTLEHKRNVLKFKSNEVLKNQNSGKNEKDREKEKAAKTGVSQCICAFLGGAKRGHSIHIHVGCS